MHGSIIPDFFAQQRLAHRRLHGNLTGLGVDLIFAHQLIGAHPPLLVFDGHRGPKVDGALGVIPGFYDRQTLYEPGEVLHASVDLPQTLFAEDVLRVL